MCVSVGEAVSVNYCFLYVRLQVCVLNKYLCLSDIKGLTLCVCVSLYRVAVHVHRGLRIANYASL